MIKFNKVLKDIKIYEAGKHIELVVREYGIAPEDVVKLASNENPIGTSPAVEIHNLIRGLNPSPGACTFVEDKRLKICKSGLGEIAGPIPSSFSPGQIIDVKNDKILVATGKDVLAILEVQPEGKRVMPVRDYLSGHPVDRGIKFAELRRTYEK